jgi:hypothetical protein
MALPSIKDVVSKDAGNRIPPIFEPGNIYARINKISLVPSRFNADSYYLELELVGEDLGENFKGFFIDPKDESRGRHKGQVARVNTSLYAYEDKTIKGKEYSRDREILLALGLLAKELGKQKEIDALPVPDTVEEYVEAVNPVLSTKDSYMHWCIGGKEYQSSKSNNINYNLFFAKPEYKLKAYSKDQAEVTKFDATSHIIKKKVAANVSSFDAGALTADFNI